MLKIITVSDLQNRTEGELRALFSQACKTLILSDQNTDIVFQRRSARSIRERQQGYDAQPVGKSHWQFPPFASSDRCDHEPTRRPGSY